MPAIQILIAGMASSYLSAPLVYFTQINTHCYPPCPNPNQTAAQPLS